MRILLIRPPYTRIRGSGQPPYFPLGLGYIAAVLSKEGYEVKIYNAENLRIPGERVSSSEDKIFYQRMYGYYRYHMALQDTNYPVWQEVRRTIHSYRPDIVGVSILSVEVGSALKISSLVKEYDERCYVIWGGPHPTFEAEDSLRRPEVDFVVRGEGERTMVELCWSLKKAKEALQWINGLSYKEKGHIIHNPDRRLLANLDSLPLPARHLVLYPESFPQNSFGSLITSRGCPWPCTFCSSRNLWQRQVRYRSPRRISEEIEVIKKNYGLKRVIFWDDAFTINEKFVRELCTELLEAKAGIAWKTATRADLIDEDLLRLMHKAGCVRLDIGIESGSPKISKYIKKEVDIDRVRGAIKLINKNNIASGTFFMAGFPQETREDLEQTFRLMKEIETTHIAFNILDPMPGSTIYEEIIQLGLIPRNPGWENSSFWPANHFVKGMTPEEFSMAVEEIAEWVFSYNNSLKIRFRRLKPEIYFSLRHDRRYLTKMIIKRAYKGLRGRFFKQNPARR